MKYNIIEKNITENYGENLLKYRGIEDVELFLNPNRLCLQSWKNLDNIEIGIKLIADTIFCDEPYALIVD